RFQMSHMRLVQTFVAAGKGNGTGPELLAGDMPLQALAQFVRLARIELRATVIRRRAGEHVDAGALEFVAFRQGTIQLSAVEHHRAAGPVGFFHQPQAVGLAVGKKDANRSRAGLAHATSSLTRRMRPVKSCCIMPVLSSRVLSRRRSSASISSSMSDSTVAIAFCSWVVGAN